MGFQRSGAKDRLSGLGLPCIMTVSLFIMRCSLGANLTRKHSVRSFGHRWSTEEVRKKYGTGRIVVAADMCVIAGDDIRYLAGILRGTSPKNQGMVMYSVFRCVGDGRVQRLCIKWESVDGYLYREMGVDVVLKTAYLRRLSAIHSGFA
jgi:hypothetical protein